MSGMTVLVTLDAIGLEFVLRVEGYEFPQFDSGWDANWLVCDVEVDVARLGSFHAHHRPAVLTVEFERFRDQLRVLDETLAGTAALEHTEEQVGLARARVRVRVRARRPAGAAFAAVARLSGGRLRPTQMSFISGIRGYERRSDPGTARGSERQTACLEGGGVGSAQVGVAR